MEIALPSFCGDCRSFDSRRPLVSRGPVAQLTRDQIDRVRLIPGTLGEADASIAESISKGLFHHSTPALKSDSMRILHDEGWT